MYIELPSTINVIVITAILIAVAFTDYKNYIISPALLAAMLAGTTTCTILYTGNYHFLSSFLGLIVGAAPFFILALIGKGGGGDVLLMGALGWCAGLYGILCIVLFSSAIYALFAFVVLAKSFLTHQGAKEALSKQYPYAPFVLLGWMIYVAIGAIF